MSRQSSRVQRWLSGGIDEEETFPADAEGPRQPTPAPRTSDEGPAQLSPIPQLPTRSPGGERAKVQGLTLDTLALRREQVTATRSDAPQPRHRDHRVPVPPPEVVARVPGIDQVLCDLEGELDTFAHAVLALSSGAVITARGLDASDASALAIATSRIGEGLGVPPEVIDVAALTLTTGDTVVCCATGTELHPAVLRVTLTSTPLGLALHHTQRAARDIATHLGAAPHDA